MLTLLVVKLVLVYNCRDFHFTKRQNRYDHSLQFDVANASFPLHFLIFPAKSIYQVPYISFSTYWRLSDPSTITFPIRILRAVWEVAMRNQLHYSPQSNTVRLSILWALKGLMVLCKNKTTYKYFLRDNKWALFLQIFVSLFEGHLFGSEPYNR